jgi:hypothetical protein
LQACPAEACDPGAVGGGYNTTGKDEITIHVDPSVDATDAQAAVNAWNDCPQVDAVETPRLELLIDTDPTAADVQFILDWPERAENAGPGWDAVFVAPNPPVHPKWIVYIDPEKNPDVRTYMHEFGHFLNLASIPAYIEDCAGSAMYILHTASGVQPCDCTSAAKHNETSIEGELDPCEYQDCGGTPVVLDLDGDGIVTTDVLTSPVWFDIDGDGELEESGWLDGSTEDAFLWIDLNGNGRVDGGQELFGNASTLPYGIQVNNGVEALAVYDRVEFGGNGDGRLSQGDEIWHRLRLWQDDNHDGVSEPREVRPLGSSQIFAIGLEYEWIGLRDSGRNVREFRGTYWLRERGMLVPRFYEDIIFRVRQ